MRTLDSHPADRVAFAPHPAFGHPLPIRGRGEWWSRQREGKSLFVPTASPIIVVSNRSNPRTFHMNGKKFNVAMIGLGFGAEFIPIYQKHPHGQHVRASAAANEKELNKVGDHFGIDKRYTKYEDVLADPKVDFVHINSPIPDHAWMSIEALKAGKHVMCTVPMATTDRGVRADLRAGRQDRPEVHDGRDGRLQPRVPVHQGACTRRASSARSSTWPRRTRRTWTAGRRTGRR